jgi:cob(I)alamin adenosyltransferase
MSNENTQKLAEQIALILTQNQNKSDDNFLRSSLEKINQRLDKIESQLEVPISKFQVPSSKNVHVSQEKFKNLEELADEIIANLQNEKACRYEPTGKPCDHCSMCNSRGF